MKLLVAAALLLPVAAAAGPRQEGASADPNRIICRTIQETGSRLARKRLCMSATEWLDYKRRAQEDIERAQTRQVNKQG